MGEHQISTQSGVIISIIGSILMVWLYIHFTRAGKRSERNAATVGPMIPGQAAARGWGYIFEDQSRTRYFTSFPFFSNTPLRAHDIVWGTVDSRSFETFALSFSDNTFASAGDGKQASLAHDFQVVWIPLKAPLPRIQLTRDKSGWRHLAGLGSARVDVESSQFNEIWDAYSSDARICHAVLNPRLIERMLEPDARYLDFTFEGSALMTPIPYLTDLGPIEAIVRTLYSIADLVPRFLFEDQSGGQPKGLGEAVQ